MLLAIDPGLNCLTGVGLVAAVHCPSDIVVARFDVHEVTDPVLKIYASSTANSCDQALEQTFPSDSPFFIIECCGSSTMWSTVDGTVIPLNSCGEGTPNAKMRVTRASSGDPTLGFCEVTALAARVCLFWWQVFTLRVVQAGEEFLLSYKLYPDDPLTPPAASPPACPQAPGPEHSSDHEGSSTDDAGMTILEFLARQSAK